MGTYMVSCSTAGIMYLYLAGIGVLLIALQFRFERGRWPLLESIGCSSGVCQSSEQYWRCASVMLDWVASVHLTLVPWAFLFLLGVGCHWLLVTWRCPLWSDYDRLVAPVCHDDWVLGKMCSIISGNFTSVYWQLWFASFADEVTIDILGLILYHMDAWAIVLAGKSNTCIAAR